MRGRPLQPGAVIDLQDIFDNEWHDITTIDITFHDVNVTYVVFPALPETCMGTKVRFQAERLLIDAEVCTRPDQKIGPAGPAGR